MTIGDIRVSCFSGEGKAVGKEMDFPVHRMFENTEKFQYHYTRTENTQDNTVFKLLLKRPKIGSYQNVCIYSCLETSENDLTEKHILTFS